MENFRENLIPLFKEFKNNGGVLSPMNTESCRRCSFVFLSCRLG